jgi:hypothetical protein
MTRRRSIDFRRIAAEAAQRSEMIVQRWLPDGRRESGEWVARNPKRADGRLGSFKINLRTTLWSDFATGESGRDLIALAAFLFDLKQDRAALRVAEMLGIDPFG